MSGGVAVDFSALSRAGTSLAAGLEESRKQTLLQALGGQVQAGDYAGAAKTAFDAGDLQTGLSLVKLGDAKAQAADFQKQFPGGLAGILGGTVDPSTGTPATAAPAAPVAPKISGGAESKAQTIVSGLVKRGIDPKVAAGLAGNFLIESSFDNTNGTGDNGTAFGLGQWRNERFNALKATAGQRGWQDIEAQLDHTANELKGSHKHAYDAALRAPDASSAALALMNKFEIPSRQAALESGPRRAAAAARFYSQFGGGASSAPTNVAGMNPSPQRVQVASADPGFVPQMPSAAADVSASPAGPAMTLPAEADPVPVEQRVQVAQMVPQQFVQAGLKPQAAAQLQGLQPGSAQRIALMVRYLSHPGASEGAREALKPLLANELQMDRENRQMTPDQKEYAWRVANGFRGSVEDMLSEKRAGADPAIIREYEYAKKNNGYTGSLLDYTKSKAEAGATRVTQNANTNAENEQDKVAQKDLGDFQVKTREGNRAASSSLASIRVMKQLVDDPSFYSGTFGGLATEAKKAAASLGLGAADGARANEGFRKLSSQFILDKAGGSLGGGFSNGDRTFIEQTGPNIENTPAGNKLILEMAERVALRQQEVHRMMVEYKRTHNGRIDDGFLSQVDAYGQQNPVFAGLENMPGVAPARNPPPAGTPAPGQRDASAQGLKPAPADEIANARAAIASGVPAEKVMQKMRQRGFVPAGL